ETNWKREELFGRIDQLIKAGILESSVDKLIKFQGDDFERIYIRLLARERGIRVLVIEAPPDIMLRFRLMWKLSRTLGLPPQMPLAEGRTDRVKEVVRVLDG